MKKYCTECGQPSEYVLHRPKFCQNCGSAFDPLARAMASIKEPAAPAPKKLEVEAEIETEIDEDENEPVCVPNISALEVEIETSRNEGVSLESMIGSSSQEKSTFQRESPEVLSKEEFLERFKKEAGSLRSR